MMRNCNISKELSRSRRGVAMLLVLIGVGAATIVTFAYLNSRDNSPIIGENVTESASARWAAASGLEIALAVLQTQTDWRIAHTDGTLLDSYSIGRGNVTIHMTDLLTGEPPTIDTQQVQVTVIADVEGRRQTASANVSISGLPTNVVDIDLSEFVAFVGESLELSDQSLIALWPSAPRTSQYHRNAIGGWATSMSSISVSNNAALMDATVYKDPDASSALVSIGSGPDVLEIELPDRLPLPAPPDHGEPETTSNLLSVLNLSGLVDVLTEDLRAELIEITNGSLKTLQGVITVVSESDLRILDSTLLIDGNVTLIVFGNLDMRNASIELTDSSSLTMYVRNEDTSHSFNLEYAYIGDERDDDSVRDASGEASWMDPQRIVIYSMAGTGNWRLRNNSVIKGTVYAPHADRIRLLDESAIYGRVVAKNVELRGESAIFYDTSLNRGFGYTNFDAALYDDDGRLKSDFRTFASLDYSYLDDVATTTDLALRTTRRLAGEIVDAEIIDVAAGEPTPRPVPIQAELVSFGTDSRLWETAP